eukprot:CAMPEP_0195013844 /NCGR_PEP_ID=MMETSP0326_2-20130528/14376_1 /TAXON_ID=2866 ORGANISM="Crypthecodinium cohnii, Strain Seligo" /NCGR_SAMPLE_ID=MMETSP0326_2 /ASSEMBLY_ACC=CAM_ASM_000348 /LENGTH=64 /DNA_ID=CAMNT_0040025041 /DNA_START=104 /DNA_END=296 /DNA_ORIENTATION=+
MCVGVKLNNKTIVMQAMLKGLAEGTVTSLAEDIDDGLEGEPLGDVLVGSQSSSELGAGQLHDLL